MLSERQTHHKFTVQNSPREELNHTRFRRERSCGYLKRAMSGSRKVEVTQKKPDEEAIKVYVRLKPTNEIKDCIPIRLKNNSLAIIKGTKNAQNLL